MVMKLLLEPAVEAKFSPRRAQDHSMRRPEMAREMTNCWISLVTSNMVGSVVPRCLRSSGPVGEVPGLPRSWPSIETGDHHDTKSSSMPFIR